MQKNQPPQKPEGMDKEAATSWAFYTANCGQLITQPILRTGAGLDQPGLRGLVVLIGMPIYAFQMRSPMVFLYWKVWLAGLVFFRLFRDKAEHSWFMGHPWLVGLVFKNFRAASLVEALLVMAFGATIHDRGLRYMLVASGGCSLAYELAVRHMDERHRIAYGNAVAEMENQRRFG